MWTPVAQYLCLQGRIGWCSSGLGVRRTGHQLVPAHCSLPHVHFVQPDVGFTDQRLLHELSSIGHQEQLNGVTSRVEAEAECLVEGRLSVMTAHSGLFLYDPLLCCHVNNIQLHVQVRQMVRRFELVGDVSALENLEDQLLSFSLHLFLQSHLDLPHHLVFIFRVRQAVQRIRAALIQAIGNSLQLRDLKDSAVHCISACAILTVQGITVSVIQPVSCSVSLAVFLP